MQELVPFVTVQELAARLGITKQALWGLVRRGTICPPIRLSARQHVWHADTAEGVVRAREAAIQERKHTAIATLRAKLQALESPGVG